MNLLFKGIINYKNYNFEIIKKQQNYLLDITISKNPYFLYQKLSFLISILNKIRPDLISANNHSSSLLFSKKKAWSHKPKGKM